MDDNDTDDDAVVFNIVAVLVVVIGLYTFKFVVRAGYWVYAPAGVINTSITIILTTLSKRYDIIVLVKYWKSMYVFVYLSPQL